jgi:LPXTG-motif cell wall-anchored protein
MYVRCHVQRLTKGLSVATPLKRFAAVLVVMLGLVAGGVALATSAQGAPYTLQPTISVSDQNPEQGASLTVTGSGFGASENVAIRVGGINLATARTDASGAFTQSITLPSDLTGTQTVTGVGQTSGATASATITISATKAAGGGGGLPNTGAAILGTSLVAVVLLGLGGAMVMISRRRRVSI